MTFDRRVFVQGAAAALALGPVATLTARAQAVKQATIYVGFPGGSGPDILARRIAEKLKGNYAENVIVDNKTGAGGQLAVVAVKEGAADGSVLLLTPVAILSVFPHTYKKLPYDATVDLAPVSMATTFDVAFAVGPAVPASVKNLNDYFAWVKANPTMGSYASPSAGSPLHFTPILLQKSAGVELTHIPYRGSVAAIPDILSGRVPAISTPVGETLAHLGENKLRVIGTSGAKRNQYLPNVPTFVEQGFRDMAYAEGFAVYVPARTPAATITRLNTSLRQALTAPDFVEGLKPMGLDASPSSPEALKAEFDSTSRRWGAVVKSIGFSADS